MQFACNFITARQSNTDKTKYLLAAGSRWKWQIAYRSF